jgi:hypothetical protein
MFTARFLFFCEYRGILIIGIVYFAAGFPMVHAKQPFIAFISVYSISSCAFHVVVVLDLSSENVFTTSVASLSMGGICTSKKMVEIFALE